MRNGASSADGASVGVYTSNGGANQSWTLRDLAPATAPTCSTTATSSSPAGSYPTTCAGAADPNYTFGYVGGTVTITTFS